MLITNHVVAGAAIGALSRGPVSAFAKGFVSHFAMDALPHYGVQDYDRFLQVAVPDGLVGLTVMGWLASRAQAGRRATVVAGMLGACLPDADKPSKLFFGRSPFPAAFDGFHGRIQHEFEDRMPQEFVVGAAGFLLSSLLLSRAARRAAR